MGNFAENLNLGNRFRPPLPKSYMDVPAGPRKSDFFYTNFLLNFSPISIFSIPIFCSIFHPSVYHFQKKSTQFFLPNWVLSTLICPKYTQFIKFWLLRLWWPPIALPNFAKKLPQRQAHIRIPCQYENPRASGRPTYAFDEISLQNFCFLDMRDYLV